LVVLLWINFVFTEDGSLAVDVDDVSVIDEGDDFSSFVLMANAALEHFELP